MKEIHKFNLILACTLTLLFFSCGKNKTSQSNLLESMGEGERAARELLGENSAIIAKGDINENGLPDIFSVIINRKIDKNKYWIQKGGILEDDKEWKIILSIDTKLSSTKGELVSMIDANYGYIIGFDSNERPMPLYISIADSAGNSISDEGMIKWNNNERVYEFIPNTGINLDDAP